MVGISTTRTKRINSKSKIPKNNKLNEIEYWKYIMNTLKTKLKWNLIISFLIQFKNQWVLKWNRNLKTDLIRIKLFYISIGKFTKIIKFRLFNSQFHKRVTIKHCEYLMIIYGGIKINPLNFLSKSEFKYWNY